MPNDRSILHRRFTLDGEPVDVVQLVTQNHLDTETQLAIGDLEPDQELELGGGAFASFTLRRTA
jgi:hypothetical protein